MAQIRGADYHRTKILTSALPWGDYGVTYTLNQMAELVNDGLNDPELMTFARVMAVKAGIRNSLAQAYAIRAWLDRVWRFVDDPNDREYLVDPVSLLDDYYDLGFIPGDCDEAAVLGAALGKAVGFSATFTVLGFQTPEGDDRYAHVFATLLTPDGGEVSLDVTRPHGPVPTPTRSMTVDV
jgi:transglutaminase-like putative cysteine protease